MIYYNMHRSSLARFNLAFMGVQVQQGMGIVSTHSAIKYLKIAPVEG